MTYPNDKVNIGIVFTQGIDTKSDDKLLAPGRLVACENGQFIESTITKRPGGPALSRRILGSDLQITEGRALAPYQDELLLLNSTNLYSYSPEIERWINKGAFTPSDLRDQMTIAFKTRSQTSVDGAICQGLEAYAWEDANGSVRCSVFDSANKVFVISDFEMNSDATEPQVCALMNEIYFFYNDDGSLKYRVLNVTLPTALTTEDTVTTDLNASSLIQIKSFGQNFICAYVNAGTDLKIAYITNGGDIGTIANGFPSAIVESSEDPNVIAITTFMLGAMNRFCVAWQSANGVLARVYDSSFGLAYGDTLELSDEGEDEVSNITLVKDDANEQIVAIWEYRDSDPQNAFLESTTVALEDGDVADHAEFLRSVGLAGQAFYTNDAPFVLITHESASGLQNTYFVVHALTGEVIAKIQPLEGGGLTPKPRLPKIFELVVGEFAVPTTFKTATKIDQTKYFSTLGVSRTILHIGPDAPIRKQQYGKSMLIEAGLLRTYDRQTFPEAGFNYSPEGLALADHMDSGSIADGTYFYVSLFRWDNAQGERERSSPSLPVSHIVSGGPKAIKATVETLRLTEKQNVVIELYRTEKVPATVYHKVAEVANNPAVDTIDIKDTLADADIVDEEPLYTDGGVLENSTLPCPSFLSIHVDDRLCMILKEKPWLTWFSHQKRDNFGIEMNENLTLRVKNNTPLTAVVAMDTNLVMFGRDSILFSTGDGPTPTGDGPYFSEPKEIHGDAGSIDGIVVTVPDGLMFKSAKGIYLLTRSLELKYIGAEVEAYNDLTLTAAVLFDDRNEVRFTTLEGVTMTYNYFARQWSTMPNQPAADAALYQNTFVRLKPDGTVFREDKALYRDNGFYYSMLLETGWIKLQGIIAGLQRIIQGIITGDYKASHILEIKVAYDLVDAWVDTYYFNTANVLAPGNNYFGSDAKYGLPGPVFFNETFASSDNDRWTDVVNAGGPIEEVDNRKVIVGSGVVANDLGFWGEIENSGGPLAGNILQFSLDIIDNDEFDDSIEEVIGENDPTVSAITLACVSLETGIDYQDGVCIIFNSFPSPSITMTDYGGDPVGGGTPLAEFDLTKRYVGKFLFNANGTITGYVEDEDGVNHELGTTSVADDFDEGPIYFSSTQTFIDPDTHASAWDNIFFHRVGLDFDYANYIGPDYRPVMGGTLDQSGNYQFCFKLSKPKCQSIKIRIRDLENVAAGESSGQGYSISELLLTAKIKPQQQRFGAGRTLQRG